MRLSHPLLTEPLLWRENHVPVLVLEHPKIFRSIVAELSAQAGGEEGDFVLSRDYEPLDCSGRLHVIRDYFSLELDDRKLQNKFQALLQSLMQEEMAAATDRLRCEITRYLEQLSLELEYPVSFSAGACAASLLKAVKLQPVLDGTEPLEKVIQYMEIYNGLMMEQCFVLVDAHGYFTSEELEELFRMSTYRKCRIMFLEHCSPKLLEWEDVCLLDRDLCELRIDGRVELG